MTQPGDCAIVNRSSVHGSFPNYSNHSRVTILFGFYKRDSVIGAAATNVHAFQIPTKTKQMNYTDEYVLKPSRVIPPAISVGAQKYLEEVGFSYQDPFLGNAEWTGESRAEVLKEGYECWRRDITIQYR